MSEKQVRRLPVVNRDKRLVGIVALGSLQDGTLFYKLARERVQIARRGAFVRTPRLYLPQRRELE